MQYNSDVHHRQSIRLNGYDYSTSGAYFITICTHERKHLFGDIADGSIELNALGDIARSHWQQLSQHHPNIIIDESIVMGSIPIMRLVQLYDAREDILSQNKEVIESLNYDI